METFSSSPIVSIIVVKNFHIAPSVSLGIMAHILSELAENHLAMEVLSYVHH